LYVDCSECKVDTDVWIRLLERAQLLEQQYLPPSTAVNSKRSVINQFERTTNGINGALIVILDDLDLEGPVNDLLYELSRFDVEGVELGTIVISENPEFRSDASNATRSSWSPTRVEFTRYGESDLVSILHRRLEAVNDGSNAVPVQTVESIANRVVDEFGGSARAAIDILRNTRPIEDTAEEALADRLDDSITTYRIQRLMAEISQADNPSKTVLVAVLHAATAANGEAPTVKTIYSTYRDITEASSVRQCSEATFREELNAWITASVIEKTANGVALCLEPELVNQAVTQEGGPQFEVDPTTVE